MKNRLPAGLGHRQRLRLLECLKPTQGMSVRELAAAMKMSYMGVKQHCLALADLGYLETWRRPRETTQTGRPALVYRLTEKTDALFTKETGTVALELLEAARTLYGPAAPEKLLYTLFQRKTEFYLSRIKATTLDERIAAFAALRNAEGHMAQWEPETNRLIERHSPLSDIRTAHPDLFHRLEQTLVSRVLQTPVKRRQEETSGHYLCWFQMKA